MKYFYYTAGALLLMTSAIAFTYFTLFGGNATLLQWVSALILGSVGMVFALVGEQYARLAEKKAAVEARKAKK